MNQEKVGKFIYEQRKKLGLTQLELANILSVTSQAISKWERGRGLPDIEMLNKLSEVFQVDISEIINGENKLPTKSNKKKYLIISIIFLVGIIITLLIIFKRQDNFNFKPITTVNSCFNVKGVIAYNKNKKSIYISNIDCTDENNNQKYLDVECILYEKENNQERIISSSNTLKNYQDYDTNNSKILKEFLKDIEFNIDNYDCSCNKENCDDLYLKINALNINNEITTYNIPIHLDNKCLSN